MLSKFVSTRSRSFSIRLIRFRFGRKTSIERRRNTSSDGQENCRRIAPFRIVVHFPDNEHQTKAARELREAFGRYFAGRAAVIQGDLNELFRIGRRSLAIGVPILIACLILAHILAAYFNEALVEESFLILGWVANWRPLEIFLYDWWPIAHRRDLYRRLSAATIESKPYPVTTPEAAI
jgi:hypothetical protein